MKIKEKVLKEIEKWSYPIIDRTEKPSRIEEVYDYKKELLEAKLEGINETLAEVRKVIDDERKIVKLVCLGLVHPSQENQKEFTEWLQKTVNFHINQIEQKIGGKK